MMRFKSRAWVCGLPAAGPSSSVGRARPAMVSTRTWRLAAAAAAPGPGRGGPGAVSSCRGHWQDINPAPAAAAGARGGDYSQTFSKSSSSHDSVVPPGLAPTRRPLAAASLIQWSGRLGHYHSQRVSESEPPPGPGCDGHGCPGPGPGRPSGPPPGPAGPWH